MSSMPERVLHRFGFKYEPKEKKTTKVDRLMRYIRDQTGVSRGVAAEIADAIVRNREVERLAIQKGWPILDGEVSGPQGDVSLIKIRDQL